MKRNLFIFGLIIFIFYLGEVSAQESITASDFFFADKSIMDIQNHMIKLVDENQTLKIEHDGLQRQVQNLERKIEGFKNANSELKEMDVVAPAQEFLVMGELRADILQKENDILILQSKLIPLKSSLLDLEDQQRLWKMKLSDLQYQRRDIEMQIHLKKSRAAEINQKEEKEVLALKNEWQGLLKKGRELDQKNLQISQEILVMPGKLDRLIQENNHLQEQMGNVKKQESLTRREIRHWENKKKIAEKSAEALTWAKKQSKKELDEEVNYLEYEYEKINIAVGDALADKQKREELTQQFIALDKENQILRLDLDRVQKRVEELK